MEINVQVHVHFVYCTKISFCVIQHENFIFRTTRVNTVIVIILSTNVIQFNCVTSEYGGGFSLLVVRLLFQY